MEEELFTIQLSYQEGRKLGLVLIDGSNGGGHTGGGELDRQVPTSPAHMIGEALTGAAKSVAAAVTTAATTVASVAQAVAASPAKTQPPRRSNKRKRELKVCISPSSIVFTFVAKLKEAAKALHFDETDFDKIMEWGRANSLTSSFHGLEYSFFTFNEESLMYALTGAIKPMMSIEKIQYRKPDTEKSCNSKQQNKITRPIGGRRSQSYFRSDHYKTFFCCNSADVNGVVKILSCGDNYPLYMTLKPKPDIINIDPIVTANSSDMEPPRKRQRTENEQTSNDGVICLLDSSDEEEEDQQDTNVVDTSKTASNDTDEKMNGTFAMIDTVPKDPPLLKFEDDDFVLTPYGPGKILTSRVERQPSVTHYDATIFNPIRIYSIDLHYGVCHIPANQIKPMTGSGYDKTIITYQKVPLNEHDLLRLRPMTYLNDSIINFYLKFVKCQVEAAAAAAAPTVTALSGWDALDGDGVHIFPSYCYTRIQNNLNGNRNSKANRERIWKDLKSWTKTVDIFKKRLLVFPINDALHWTVCIVCNPGRLVRRYSKEFSEMKKNLELKNIQALGDIMGEMKKATWAKLDATSPYASQAGVEPLSLLPLMNGDDHDVQPESSKNDIAMTDNNPQSELSQQNEQSATTNTTPEESKPNLWACDFCKSGHYGTFDLALEHESMCDENINWCMIHFDSGKHFKLHKSTEILGNIRKYLNAYYEAEYEPTHPGLVFTTKNMPGFSATVPQQDNAKDCGVYMLEMAERMMRNTPEVDCEFVKRKGTSKNNFFGSNSFSKDVIVQKREDILQLIQRLRREETSL